MGVVTHHPGPAVERLAAAERALLTSHMSPDGDAVGSELALAGLARALDVEPVIVNRDPAPAGLDEMPGSETIRIVDALHDELLENVDLVVTLECPDLDRPGLAGLDRRPILNIDHHRGNARYGEVNYLDEDAPAVGEMVWRMYRAAGITPDADAATAALVALSTDTGDFRYSNATPRAFTAASEMVAAGARPEQVAEWVHERRTEASIRLLGEALRTLEVRAGGRLALMWVDPAAFERAGAAPADTDDLINVPRTIAGVRIAVFLKQWEPGVVRVSLRSKGHLDVRSVAARFGGGGHTNAAGCTVRGEIAQAREALLPLLEMLLEEE